MFIISVFKLFFCGDTTPSLLVPKLRVESFLAIFSGWETVLRAFVFSTLTGEVTDFVLTVPPRDWSECFVACRDIVFFDPTLLGDTTIESDDDDDLDE